MKRKLTIFLICLSALLQAQSSQYLYDQNGNPLFVKIPINCSLKEYNLLVDFPILVDEIGPFFAALIQFGHWICPFCGILNPVQTCYCVGQNCPAPKRTS